MSALRLRDREIRRESSQTASQRYWLEDEHERYLQAVAVYGYKDARSIARVVRTRTPTQVRTHTQKHLKSLDRNSRATDESRADPSAPEHQQGMTSLGTGFWDDRQENKRNVDEQLQKLSYQHPLSLSPDEVYFLTDMFATAASPGIDLLTT